MKKPDGLKRVLLAAVPGLAADPTRLSIFVDKGKIGARGTGSLSFEYSYTLNVVLQDYAGDVDALMVPVLAWIAEVQPELFDKDPREPFSFEVELLDGAAVDVSIDLDLTELVRVVPKPGGGYFVTHLDEPRAIDAFDDVAGINLRHLLLSDDVASTAIDLSE